MIGIVATGLFSVPSHAQDTARTRFEKQYRTIQPRPVTTGEKIEVIDFFWYGCPYCNELQPALEAWLRRKPADVELRRIPVILRDAWSPHARIYYTLEALGETQRLHSRVYHSYHVEELHMSKPEVMVEWAVRHGIDRDRWLAAYNSLEVEQQVRQATELTRNYDVQGTPSLVVDGRYITSSGMTESVRGVIPVLNELIRIAREQRAKR